MVNKYFNVDKSPYHTNCYFISIGEEVCKQMIHIPKTSPFSYQMIYIALFGLEPQDFFAYIQMVYKAKVSKTKNSIWKTITFDNLADAWTFAKELDRRFAYCIENKFFEGE